MILQKCGNCLSTFETAGTRYCPECGESKHRMSEEQRERRARRARKVCPECKAVFSMLDVGLDLGSRQDRRSWNSRTRCRDPQCEEVAWERYLDGYRQSRNPSQLTKRDLSSHLKSMLCDLEAIPNEPRDPRYVVYEQMMGKRR